MCCRRNVVAVLFAAVCTVVACSRRVDTTAPIPSQDEQASNAATGWKLTADEATRIAEAAAEESGVELADYRPPTVAPSDDEGKRHWILLYEGKIPVPGNHFAAIVDDEFGTAEIIPGE